MKRINNNFQFLDVPRREPEKKDIVTRSTEFVEIYTPFDSQEQQKKAECVKVRVL